MQPNAIQFNRDLTRVAVVLPTWVGDFVMATPTLRAIRNRFRVARITFVQVPNLSEIVEGGDWMDEVVEWPGGSGKGSVLDLLRLAGRLRREAFDLGVLLPNSFRSGLLMTLAGARRRIGYDRDGRGILLTDRLGVPRVDGEILPHPICSYYGGIATALGCDTPGDRLELFTTANCEEAIDEKLASRGLGGRRPLVVFAPGASFGASKLWMPDRFSELANRLHRGMGATTLVTCGPGEEPIARRIAECASAAIELFDDPRLTLGELKALIKRCDLLVCNDTGPRHIAKAFDVPVVTIFGPTHQAWTDTDYPKERKVSIPVDCGPCQQKVCPLGHLKCLTGVTVEMVYDCCAGLFEPENGDGGVLVMSKSRRSIFCSMGDVIVAPEFADVLEANGLTSLEALMSHAGTARLDKAGLQSWRERLRLELSIPGGGCLVAYMKRYRSPPLRAQCRRSVHGHMRHGTAWIEWYWGGRLINDGIDVARPIVMAESVRGGRELASVFVTASAPGESLETLAAQGIGRWDRGMIDELAQFVGRFHRLGYVHRDLYLSHIFFDASGPAGHRFCLIDLQRVMRPRWFRRRWIVKDLAALNYSSPDTVLADSDRVHFLQGYVREQFLTGSWQRLVSQVRAKTSRISRHDARRLARLARSRPMEADR